MDVNSNPATGAGSQAATTSAQTIDRLCARVHLGLREGRPAAGDVVELACELLDQGHGGNAVREAVERIPGQVSPSELADSAARILEEAGFDPGFVPSPERLRVLRQALETVARDLPTAGIRGDAELDSAEGDDLPRAVAAIAGRVQCELMERTWKVWPLCAGHGLGVHSVVRNGVALWWCSADGGHPVAPVGALPEADAIPRGGLTG